MSGMISPGESYARWRWQRWPLPESFRDSPAGDPPPERLLQAIWRHQRLRRQALKLADGTELTVLHPGFASRDPGPDFRQAVLKIGAQPAQTGDIEIDQHPGLWQAHHHHENPNFARVLLHVVWDTPPLPRPGLATLTLRPHLDSPVEQLATWLGTAEALVKPSSDQGHCAAVLATMPAPEIQDLLRQAAAARFHSKAYQLQARARQAGWEQALWEGVFNALGYKNNRWPLQRLAELLPTLANEGGPGSRLGWEARLLGVAGFLGADPGNANDESRQYQTRLWDQWWRERPRWTEVQLPSELWDFASLRPANHPQRRLALAADWLARDGFFKALEAWFTNPGEQPAESLLKLLEPAPDSFWQWHCTLGSNRSSQPQTLLGTARASELAVNVILPWFWIRARACGNPRYETLATNYYYAWPASDDNTVLRLARQRMFPHLPRGLTPNAATQQGLPQLTRDWCDSFDATCQFCPFPDVLRQRG